MIVYARSDLSRKPGFQVLTTINKKAGKLSVKKEPLTKSAVEHLSKMHASYKFLKDKDLPLNILKPTKKDDGSLVFDFIEGMTLDSKFSEYIFSGQIEQACEIIDKLLSKIKNLSSEGKEDFSKNKSFVSIFGDAYSGNYFSSSIGNIDFNLDNLIEKDDSWWLIDYEWVFDFSIPVDFICSRIIADAFWRTNDYFMLGGSVDEPVVSINDRVFVSKEIFNKYKEYFNQIPKVIKSDQYFQNYVRGKRTDSNDVALSIKEFTNPPFPGIDQKYQNSQRDINRLRSELASLTKEHEYAVEELRKAQSKIERIYNNPAIKPLLKLRRPYRKFRNLRR